MKKIKLFFVAMLMSAVAGNLYAQSVGQTIKIDGVTYEYRGITDGNRWVRIIAVDETVVGEVTFPSTIRNEQDSYDFAVQEIYNCDFGSNEISSLTLPEGMIKITSHDLGGIHGSNIKVINIPSTVTTYSYSVGDVPGRHYEESGIGTNTTALTAINVADGNQHFSSDNGVLYNKDKTKLIRYPGGKTETSFTVPEGVIELDYNAIVNTYLTTLTFATTTTTTADANSILCPNLENIGIPVDMTQLPALTHCDKLQNYFVAQGNPKYSDIDGVLCNAEGTVLINYPIGRTATDYQIPSSIEEIGVKAFYHSKLETVDFEGSQVVTIKNNAFEGGAGYATLKKVLNLPTTLRTIERQAFLYQGLTSIELPEGLETIGELAFVYNYSLTKVTVSPESDESDNYSATFPNSLKTIGNGAFDYTKVTSVYIPENVSDLTTAFTTTTVTWIEVSPDNNYYSSIQGVVFNKNATVLVEYPAGKTDEVYEIPEGTVELASRSMYRNPYLKQVIFPSSLIIIRNAALAQCDNLSSVELPENCALERIEANAFGLTKLTEFDMPASVNFLGVQAFGNTLITSFKIPDNSALTEFTGRVFNPSTSLTELSIGKNTKIQKVDFLSFCSIPNLTNFTIDEGNTDLTSLASFGTLVNLETVAIAADAGSQGNGITVQGGCFQDMENLTSVVLPAAVTRLGNLAFSGCTNLKSVTIADTEENPCRLTVIGENVFYKCGIESFDVPSSVKTIAYEAFRECPALTVVNIPAITNNVHFQAFESCHNLTAINVDKANKKYSSSDGIFLDKMKEQLIIYPAGKAEDNFTLLPPSITTIGEMSFFNNPKLKNVMIPKKVTSIGVNAFNQCSELKNIVLLGDNPTDITIGNDAFLRVPENATIWLRYDQQNENITNWNGFTNIDFCKMSADEDANHTYEFFPMAEGSANVLSVKNNTTDYTLVMPETVSDGQQEYTVDYLGDYMLEDAQENIKEVVVKHTPKYIGALAFNSAFCNADAFLCDDVDDMSTIRFEYDKETFNGRYNEGQNLYMKQSVAERVLADESWTDLADVVDYHIPLPAISTDLGTFSREFAVDIDDINPVKENPQVIAFTAGRPYCDRTNNLVTVHMVSINHEGENEDGSSGDGDGTFIPAYTGVLLKAYAGSTTSYDKNAEGKDKGAFYKIAEIQTEGYQGDNCMGEVTVKSKTIQPVEEGKKNFIISGGKLWSITKQRDMTVHKAYLSLDEESVPEGANVALVFNEPNSDDTDSISSAELTTDNEADGYIYNLQGQRVNGSVNGLYIKNGKKYIKK